MAEIVLNCESAIYITDFQALINEIKTAVRPFGNIHDIRQSLRLYSWRKLLGYHVKTALKAIAYTLYSIQCS